MNLFTLKSNACDCLSRWMNHSHLLRKLQITRCFTVGKPKSREITAPDITFTCQITIISAAERLRLATDACFLFEVRSSLGVIYLKTTR